MLTDPTKIEPRHQGLSSGLCDYLEAQEALS